MNRTLKHIKIFEEIIPDSKKSGIFAPIFKLKEVAEEAASFNDYQKGIDMINDHLKNHAWDIREALDDIKNLPSNHSGNHKIMINIYSLLLPFIEKWGKELLNKKLSSEIELNKIDDIETGDSDIDLDFDADDIEIDD